MPTVNSSVLSANGVAVMAPFYPEQIVSDGEEHVLSLVKESVELAVRYGAQIVGLGGFTSVVGDEGEIVSKQVDVSVTSGNTYTALLALKGIYKACELLEIDLQQRTVIVIGATGDIGSICSRILAPQVGSLVIIARDKRRLDEMRDELAGITSVTATCKVRDAVRKADVILSAASAIGALFEPSDLKPGAILCDVALPHVVGVQIRSERPDVLVFEGGMCKLPTQLSGKKIRRVVTDRQSIFGCLAETILLDLEKRYECYSLGRGNITQSKLKEMEALAEYYGFGVADFAYSGQKYTNDEIEYIRDQKQTHRSSIFA